MFKYIITLFITLTLVHCVAKPSEEQNLNPTTEMEPSPSPPPMEDVDIKELQKTAQQFSFEDIQNMPLSELTDIYDWSGGVEMDQVIWFKDFKTWEVHKLDEEKLQELRFAISILSNRKKLISNDDWISHLTLNQLNSLNSEQIRGIYNIYEYPVEYIHKLDKEQLNQVSKNLSKEQVLSLSNEQIIEARVLNPRLGAWWCKNSEEIDVTKNRCDTIPFSPERIRSFGDKGLKTAGSYFFSHLNKEQFDVLTLEQVQKASDHHRFWPWKPHQLKWFSPEQVAVLPFNKRTQVQKGQLRVLSLEQLKGFSKEKTAYIDIEDMVDFSPEQLKALQEYGTSNELMDKIIRFQDAGAGIFERPLFYEDYVHESFEQYIPFLYPEQLSSMSLTQAESLSFTAPLKFTPEQIAQFPYFVHILNFDENSASRLFQLHKDYYTKASNSADTPQNRLWIYRYEKFDEEIRQWASFYDTLNHAKILTREQIRAIPPEQIPLIPSISFDIINERYFENHRPHKEFTPFTFEQLKHATMEQFRGLVWEKSHLITDEHIDHFTLEQTEYTLGHVGSRYLFNQNNPSIADLVQKLKNRKNYLLSLGH